MIDFTTLSYLHSLTLFTQPYKTIQPVSVSSEYIIYDLR